MPLEISVHADNLSPYIRYAHEIELPPHFALVNRRIYDNEFIFAVAGQASITQHGETRRLKQGDLLHIRPQVEHTMAVGGEAAFHCICVHFDWTDIGQQFDFSPFSVYLNRSGADESQMPTERELADRPADNFVAYALPSHVELADFAPVLVAFRDIVRHYDQQRISSKLFMKAALLNIIAHVSQELMTVDGVRKGQPHERLVLASIAYMREHCAWPITHAELAAAHGFTPKYFGTIFKRATGVAIADYLQKIRIKRAKELLVETSHTIQEIAVMSGIPDIYYFSKVFKKIVGLSPSNYRKSIVSKTNFR